MWPTIFGALGVCISVIIYQQKSRKGLLTWKLISDVVWMTHYISLAAYSGAAIAGIGIFRETVFFGQMKKQEQNEKSTRLWLLFFLLCSIVSAIVTWKSPFSILPAAASMISVISFWQKRPNLTRYLAFPIACCMLTYDVFAGSVMGIVNETFTLISTTVGVVRYAAQNAREVDS